MLLVCDAMLFDILAQRCHISLRHLLVCGNVNLIAKDKCFVRERHIVRIAFLMQHIELISRKIWAIPYICHNDDCV